MKKAQSVTHLMYEERTFPPTDRVAEKAHLRTQEHYEKMYRRSLEEGEAFWLEQAETLEWFRKPTVACRYNWETKARKIEHRWFEDGRLNLSQNCLDRHLGAGRGDKPAIIWQGDAEEESKTLTYKELHREVCRFAAVLKKQGIQKGDRVCLYLPMIPELAVAMLACARIGAIHSIVFAGFSAESLAHRIRDCGCRMIITANCGIRGGKRIPLKEITDAAAKQSPSVESVLVVKRDDTPCGMQEGRDLWLHELLEKAPEEAPPEPMDAEDPLFILYTSGSTGKPKGVVHTQAGYLLHASLTHKYIFDLQEEDVYWCTADIGWITGHSYVIYGPLANGAATLMFEGVPTHPDPGRFWQIVEKYKVTLFYTAPTAIRALICHGEKWAKKHDLSTLRVLGTVGEPINPEAWMWYYEMIGNARCPIVDTWWQTETGGIMIAPFPGCHTLKPGSASRPFFGVDPVILKEDGSECAADSGGALCIRSPWPGMMRTTWGDHDRFIDTYFTHFDNLYFTGDSCRKDPDGDFWLLGRCDDVVNVSGHRLGTAEIESALVSHGDVAEAAVVPLPHKIKGQGLHAFVTLVDGVRGSEELKKELSLHVREEIGPIAVPDKIRFAAALPKTRSGKIMRRILRKIAEKDHKNIGDTTTLADPAVIEALIEDA